MNQLLTQNELGKNENFGEGRIRGVKNKWGGRGGCEEPVVGGNPKKILIIFCRMGQRNTVWGAGRTTASCKKDCPIE